MSIVLQIIFWGSVAGIFFAYLGYPLSLVILATLLKVKTPAKKRITPNVTFVVCAYNEEKRIREKLDNTVALDYPRENLQILFASDGSTDNTNNIILEFETHGIQLLALPKQNGKEFAQREAVQKANGDILIFSDASTILPQNALHEIIDNFTDPSIGCVSSMDKVIPTNDDHTQGEGLYVRYEMYIREIESKVSTVVGLSGSFFAARKEVCQDFAPNMDSDFRTLLSSIRKGMRGIVDPLAIGYYKLVPNAKQEFKRKVRTVLRGITVFFANVDLLNPLKYGFFSYQYFSHKLLKWLVPFFLIALLSANAILGSSSTVYQTFFALQLGFYFFALLGLFGGKIAELPFVKIPSFFTLVNVSILVAWVRYIKGDRIITWQPSKR